MIKTLGALFAIYAYTNAQQPPVIPAIPSVPQSIAPATTQPVATQPIATQPIATQPIATQPIATEPIATQPVATQPVATQPAVIPPVVPPEVTQPPIPPIVATQIISIPPVSTQSNQPAIPAQTPPQTSPITQPQTPPITQPQTPPITQPQTPPITPPQTPPITPPQTPPQTPPITPPNTNQIYVAVTDPPITPSITQPIPSQPATTVSLLPPGQFVGAYNQICDFNLSPLRDVNCKAAGQPATEQYPGFMKCERGYDCCMCGSITCGNQWVGCNTFSAGDQGVFGVQQINVYGRDVSLGGADMNFIGYEAATNAIVTGHNIKSIRAAGELALLNAKITVNPIKDFAFECSGVAACDNLNLEIVLPGPPEGYRCNPNIMFDAVELNTIHCGGRQSCRNAHIKIINKGCFDIDIQQLECTLPDSCMGTTFEFIENPNGKITVNSCDVNGQIPAGINAKCGISMGGQGGGAPQWTQNQYGQWVPV